MKACKIILIILLALSTLKDVFTIFAEEGDEQLIALGRLLVGKTIWWLLYVGAGITNL